MSSEQPALRVEGVSKCYRIYDTPWDRLRQAVLPNARSIFRRGAKRYFREYRALQDVSFEVRKGETLGIIGRNGSGKSTLLQILSGTLSPTSGRVVVDGRVAPLLELGAGFNPEFTGRENVVLNATLLGLTEQRLRERFDEIVAFADIGDFLDQPVKTYSSGMFVRLAFAVIAHVDADILVVDEALSVGDAFFVQKCMRFLRGFMERGTVVFVSHDTSAVINLCDRVVWLRDGAIAMVGKPKEVAAVYLEDLYQAESGTDLSMPASATARADAATASARDMRQDLINATSLRADVELAPFSGGSQAFGLGGATITDAGFFDEQGRPLSWVVGGEMVRLRITARAAVSLARPIIGFEIYDRLGQTISADNTYLATLDDPVPAIAGQELVAEFEFRMPAMREGDYTLSAAIADGTQAEHVQHHWLHDALAFHVHTRNVCLGLVGIPMQRIRLCALDPGQAQESPPTLCSNP